MKTSHKSCARAGAIAGFAGLALLANPAVGSATVAGSIVATWPPGDHIVVEFTGVSSPTLLGCRVVLTERSGFVTSGAVTIAGDPGTGTYRSPALAPGHYTINAFCVDADGVTPLAPPGYEFSPAVGLEELSGSVGQMFGS